MIAILPFSPPNFKIRGSMIDKINKIVGNKEPAVKKISLKLPVFVIPITTKLITVFHELLVRMIGLKKRDIKKALKAGANTMK